MARIRCISYPLILLLRTLTPETELNSNSTERNLPNGTKAQTSKIECMVQDKPGVYLSLTTLPDGSNELKRVRSGLYRLLSPF